MNPLFLLFVLPLGLLAQTPAPVPDKPPESIKPAEAKPAAARNEMPPEAKAFNEAMGKKDVEEKIAALQKFIADYPKHFMAANAKFAILSAILKEWPGDEPRIQAQIKVVREGVAKDEVRTTDRHIAEVLAGASVDFQQAEKLARRALKLNNQAAWIAEQKEAIAKRKGKIPSDEELIQRYRSQLGQYQATLGEILYKEGKSAEAEKQLKLAVAVRGNPPASPLRILAMLSERRKEDAAAFDYMATLRLSGSADAADIKRTETLFSKSHGDSSGGLDEYLDDMYRKKFPNLLHEERYQKTAARTDRAVLAEVFTGSGCPPCVAADLVFDAALDRYTRQDVVVLMYHQHIPRPDPMTNPATLGRAKFYDVHGVPSYALDGKLASGGGPRNYVPEMWEKVNPDLEKRLEVASGGTLLLEASAEGQTVKVKASPGSFKADAKELKIQVALVEELLRYTGENGIRFHPMVVRAMGGPEEAGFKLDPAKPAPVEVSFDLSKIVEDLSKHLDAYEKDKKITFLEKKTQIDRAKLGVVAFVQDQKSKEILQSVYVRLGGHVTTD